MRLLLAATALILTATVPVAVTPVQADEAASRTNGYSLEALVLLNRHGVRSPLNTSDLEPLADKPWPSFGVKDGNLTKRGKTLSKTLGKFYGAYARNDGFLPAKGCPAKKKVWFRSDNDQRTIKTAEALQQGMLPGCGYKVNTVASGIDPLIAPVDYGICKADEDNEEAALNGLLGGSWDPSIFAYGSSLDQLQDVLNCCQPSICEKYDVKSGCTLTDLPTSAISGIATTTSEIFLMQYANGMSKKKVGWGRISSPQHLSALNAMHSLAFWSYNANPYTARYQGSNLLDEIVGRVKKASKGKGADLSVIVAHDNNLLNIAGLLGLSWFVESYQQNQVPPGAGIAFELWRNDKTGKPFVSIRYRAQTIDQLRKNAKLTLQVPPADTNLTGLACGSDLVDGRCPARKFLKVAAAAIDETCVGAKK